MEVLQTVLLSSNTTLATPPPGVQVTALDANAVELDISFSVLDIAVARKAKSELLDLVYRHAKATGLSFAPPTEGPGIGSGPSNPRPLSSLTTSILLDKLWQTQL